RMSTATVSASRRVALNNLARSRWLPFAVLGVLMVGAAYYILSRADGATFYIDEWDFVLARRGWDADALLQPHYQHLMLVPLLIWKAGLELWGMDAHPVFRVISVLAHLVVVALVFAFAYRRGAAWLGVLAASL